MMEVQQEEYSVLMAVYQQDIPEWVNAALHSMLVQSLPPSEIVIIKDGPLTQGLERVLAETSSAYPGILRMIALKENQGLGLALKRGVQACSYEWIVRMDADDYSAPRRCEMQFKALRENCADIVGCDVDEFVGSPEKIVAHRVFPETHDELYHFAKRRTPFAHPSVVMRRQAVLNAGNYRAAYLHEDFDLFIRMFQAGCRGYNVKMPYVSVRVSNNFYARRGGMKYLHALLDFNRQQFKSGWMRPTDYVIRSGANIAFCLLPNKARDQLYRRILRK